MNYTEKYHLPQWAESDRVMRTDFNQMCADIESGLAAGAQGTEAAEELTFERLCRMAYNHYHHVRTLETMPRQLGVFHQKFGKGSSQISGIIRQDECCYMGNGSEVLDAAGVFALFHQVSKMKVVKNTSIITPLVVEFTAPGPGKMENLILSGSYRDNDGTRWPAKVELQNLDTGEKEFSGSLTLQTGGSSGAGFGIYNIEIPFHGGCLYQLTVTPQSHAFSGEYEIWADRFKALTYQLPEASVSHIFQEDEGSTCGLVAVEYDSFGESTLTLLWDGEEITPWTTRTITVNGKRRKEAVYRREGAVPAESTLELKLDCPIYGEIWLYNWGAILL